MKFRINGNSLRLRVTRSELERLVKNARIEETIYFSPDEQSRLTYVLEHSPDSALRKLPLFFLQKASPVLTSAMTKKAWVVVHGNSGRGNCRP